MAYENEKTERDVDSGNDLCDPALLAARGEFARLAADHSPDVQILIDPAGDIRYGGGSVQQLAGISHEEVLQVSIWDFVHPEDLESAAGAFNEASRMVGYHLPTRFRIRSRDGEWVDSEIKGNTFNGPGGTWLILSLRKVGERNEVIERRRSIETLIREASTVCSAVSWPELDNVLASFIERLVQIVEATSFSMGWEADGVLRLGATWPENNPLSPGGRFEQLWPSETLSSSLLHFSADLEQAPPSLLRDRMIVDGVRAVVELPLTDDAPWGVARFTFRRSAAKWDDANVDLVKVLVMTLMSTVRRCTVERTMQEQATTDPLTGLMNRSELYRVLDLCLSDRRGNGRVAVFYGDLDNFKQVNDVYGHDAGDDFLCSVASALRSSVRAVDIIARIGGDEFIVVCPDIEEVDQIEVIRERIREAVDRIDTFGLPISMSLGMAMAEPEESSNDVLRRADQLMYKIKRSSARRELLAIHG